MIGELSLKESTWIVEITLVDGFIVQCCTFVSVIINQVATFSCVLCCIEWTPWSFIEHFSISNYLIGRWPVLEDLGNEKPASTRFDSRDISVILNDFSKDSVKFNVSLHDVRLV